jgi:hypothetical protein
MLQSSREGMTDCLEEHKHNRSVAAEGIVYRRFSTIRLRWTYVGLFLSLLVSFIVRSRLLCRSKNYSSSRSRFGLCSLRLCTTGNIWPRRTRNHALAFSNDVP